MTEDTPDPSVLAAEYALGLLSPDEASEAEARIETDPAFRREVDLWQERLARFIDEVPDVRPPGTAWAGLSNRIVNLTPFTGRPAAAARGMPLRWLAAALVIGVGLGATGARLASALYAGPSQPVTASTAASGGPRTAVAVLYPETGAARFVVSTRLGDNRLLVVPTAPWPAGPSVPCLWGVAGDDDPVFLARVSTQQPSEVALPEAMLKMASVGVVFVMTAEAPGWDSKSASQGEIVAHGKLAIAALADGPSL